MKIGNTSQSVVPVPNFFLNRTIRDLETFQVSRRRRFFRENDLFQMTKDINLNNNPRNINRKLDELNKEKYIPVYQQDEAKNNKWFSRAPEKTTTSNPLNQTNHSHEPTTEVDGFEKFKAYMHKTNSSNIVYPNLRDEIKTNVTSLLDRINSNFNIPKWSRFDSRTTFNMFYTETFSPITAYNHQNETENSKFRNTLKDKISSLTTVNQKSKKKIIENTQDICIEQPIVTPPNYDSLLSTVHSNLCELKKNNQDKYAYTEEEEKVINDNKYVYTRFANTGMFKEFPSPTRMEFTSKSLGRRKRKMDDEYLVKKSNYGYTEKELFNCSDVLWSRPLHRDHFK